MDSSATKLFKCDLGHKIIVSWEATNRFSKFFACHIGGMIGHIGEYMYNFSHFILPSVRCTIQNFQTCEWFCCSLYTVPWKTSLLSIFCCLNPNPKLTNGHFMRGCSVYTATTLCTGWNNPIELKSWSFQISRFGLYWIIPTSTNISQVTLLIDINTKIWED